MRQTINKILCPYDGKKPNQNKKFDNKKIQGIKKFHRYKMDNNWQRIGGITSEKLETFLAISKARIKIYGLVKHTTHEYVFKKNSQISIQNRYMVFEHKDVKHLTVEASE